MISYGPLLLSSVLLLPHNEPREEEEEEEERAERMWEKCFIVKYSIIGRDRKVMRSQKKIMC